MISTYQTLIKRLNKYGIKTKIHILYNKISNAYKEK